MPTDNIPEIDAREIEELLALAEGAPRRRHPKILHNPGDVFNRVINAMMHDTYMQPHLHPGEEKIEHIHLIRGKIAVLFFDDFGNVKKVIFLQNQGVDWIAVPAFTWHTYVILSDSAATYETMMGEYAPKTWKEMAPWAPAESTADSDSYRDVLKARASLDGRAFTQRRSSSK